jgi:thymidylate synthase ThyX
VIEPFSWITVLISSTKWAQFFKQRCHHDAQPEMQKIAEMMREVYTASKPRRLEYGEWHRPYVTSLDLIEIGSALPGTYQQNRTLIDERLNKIGVARCARVSFLSHEGKRDVWDDIRLTEDKLIPGGHWSPFEHVATPAEMWADVVQTEPPYVGRVLAHPYTASNFAGWNQYRKLFATEFVEDELYHGVVDDE